MMTQTTLRRCDRCRRRLRGGTDWNVVVERGVITGLLCPDCQTPESATQLPVPEWRIAMRCKLCGRFLTDPRSVTAGVGPTCAARIGALNG
jgi:hypothetical protein